MLLCIVIGKNRLTIWYVVVVVVVVFRVVAADWLSQNKLFQSVMPLLHTAPKYRRALLTGLVVTVGGLTESLV